MESQEVDEFHDDFKIKKEKKQINRSKRKIKKDLRGIRSREDAEEWEADEEFILPEKQ